jgi:hypothetical protein
MLKNASEGILAPKNTFFLKILNFVQSFVDCKVSLADGSSRHTWVLNCSAVRSTSSSRSFIFHLPFQTINYGMAEPWFGSYQQPARMVSDILR